MSHVFFFFNDTATTEIYTLSLHDALPISEARWGAIAAVAATAAPTTARAARVWRRDRAGRTTTAGMLSLRRASAERKSTRLNSSQANILYSLLFLKKKNNDNIGANYVNVH